MKKMALQNFYRPFGNLDSAIEALDLRQSVAALSLFLAVIFGFDGSYYRIVVQAALIVVLLKPRLLLHPILWLCVSSVATLTLIPDWSVADNHKYLLVYWLWVMTLSCAVTDTALSERVLTAHARFFLVFVFLAAAIQKASSPTYMSGEMFEGQLLLDTRFKAFSHIMGIDQAVTDDAKRTVALLQSPFNKFDGDAALLPASDRSRTLALVITWYDFLVQLAIGLFFIPRWRQADILGHALLLFFVFTTYLPAPVYGFGFTIAIYGFTLVKDKFPAIRLLYFAAFVAILAYQAPWRAWVLSH